MNKPCLKCSAYDKKQDECGVLLKLQVLPLDKLDGGQQPDERLTSRASHIDELLIQRPCRFSRQIMRWASYFTNKRGLKPQDEPDIHNDVVESLAKLDFQKVAPTYDDFRRYITSMTRSAVHRGYIQIHGAHCCGTCSFFQEGSKRCSCPDLQPVSGQQYIQINYSTKPRDVIHNSMLSVSQDDVLDWLNFCTRLGREGNEAAPCASRRIWQLLPQEMQKEILNVTQTNGVEETFKLRFVNALNDLLKRQDFYKEIYFRDISLTVEAKELTKQSKKSLTARDGQRLNRLLIEASYPKEIARSYRGCSYYSSKQFVDAGNLDSLTTLNINEIEDTLEYMESLGPRQRKLAHLLRIMLDGYKLEESGYEIGEIAKQTGKHRTTIPKELYGTSEREKDEKGEEIIYHQAGAFDIFRAIYTGAIFALEREGKHLWSVVNRRDFSSDAVQPSFSKISSELDLSKHEAIERYIDGWKWIKAQSTKGGGSVSRLEDDQSRRKIEQVGRARQTVKVSEMSHPDFHVLLTYAEGDLNQVARKYIAGHILVCEHCSSELEHIEMEILPEKEHPTSIVERGRWLAARVAGRLDKASDIAGNNDSARATYKIGWFNSSRFPSSLNYGLALALVVLLLVLMLGETRRNRIDEQLTSLNSSVDSLKQQNESLKQENAVLREQAQKSTASAEQAQQQTMKLELMIAELEDKNNMLKTSPAQRIPQPSRTITVKDTNGTATIGNDVIVNSSGDTNSTSKLPPALSQPVREFVTTGSVQRAQLASNALTTISATTRRGETRSGGTAEHLRALPISPVLTAVRTTGPTLLWVPVPEAESYQVKVVSYPTGKESDKKEWLIPVGKQAQFTFENGTFSRGQIYLWEVLAKMSEGEQITVSPRAGFWVLDEKALHEVETVEQSYNSSALVLSSVYVKYGLCDDALIQVRRLKARNPTSRFVETMLRRLSQQCGKQ
jgi:cell division protein FtsB